MSKNKVMFKGLTNMMLTAVVLQIKMVLIYYCLYSSIVFNFMMSVLNNPLLPQYIKDNDKLILLGLSIISAYSLNSKMKNPPKQEIPQPKLNILKPGQKIN